MNSKKEEMLRQRALRVCEQIRKLDHAITDAAGASGTDETLLFQALEDAGCCLVEVADKIERDMLDWGPELKKVV